MIFNEKNNQPPNKIWKAGFYIRLSREDVEKDNSIYNIKTYNKTESESITTQRAILSEFADKYADIEVIDEYVDDGYTGTNFNRPSFQRMFEDIKDKKIDCVIVKDLSRFGRNYAEVGNYLEVVFPLLNIRFMAIIDNCDSYLRPESVSNIMVPVKNIMNENYCRDLSLKVKSACEARKRQGLFVGTYAPYGYQKEEKNCNKLIIDEEAATIVRRIFKDYISGMSKMKIAKTLNEEGIPCPANYKKGQGISKYTLSYGEKVGWKDSSVRRILTSEIYIGTLVQGCRHKINYKVNKFRQAAKETWIKVPNAVEPIIDNETFEKAQSLLKRDTRKCFNGQDTHVLAGFVRCADCKHGMSKQGSRTWGNKGYNSYYTCSTYKNCGKSVCSSHRIKVEDVEKAVLEYLKKCVQVAINFDTMVGYINNLKLETIKTDNLEKILKTKNINMQKKEQFIDGLYPDYKMGIITQEEYQKYKQQATLELENIKTEIESLSNQIEEIRKGTCEENEFIKHFKEYKDIEKLDKQMIVDLIDNIWIHEGKYIEIDIKYKDQYAWAIDFMKSNQQILAANANLQKAVIGYGENK